MKTDNTVQEPTLEDKLKEMADFVGYRDKNVEGAEERQLTPLQELIEWWHLRRSVADQYEIIIKARSLLPKERQREEEMERLKEEIISMRGNSKAASGLLAKARDEIKELKEELRRWESGELNIEM